MSQDVTLRPQPVSSPMFEQCAGQYALSMLRRPLIATVALVIISISILKWRLIAMLQNYMKSHSDIPMRVD